MYFLQKQDPVRFARKIGVRIGRGCKIVAVNGGTFGREPYLIEIGDHVEISGRVNFINHDGGAWVFRDEFPKMDVIEPIKIGNNVYIGFASIIMPGSIVEDNCVIGAGSLVLGCLKGDSVYAGRPARKISELEDYKEKLAQKSIGTKLMEIEEKQRYLQTLFQIKQ